MDSYRPFNVSGRDAPWQRGTPAVARPVFPGQRDAPWLGNAGWTWPPPWAGQGGAGWPGMGAPLPWGQGAPAATAPFARWMRDRLGAYGGSPYGGR